MRNFDAGAEPKQDSLSWLLHDASVWALLLLSVTPPISGCTGAQARVGHDGLLLVDGLGCAGFKCQPRVTSRR